MKEKQYIFNESTLTELYLGLTKMPWVSADPLIKLIQSKVSLFEEPKSDSTTQPTPNELYPEVSK